MKNALIFASVLALAIAGAAQAVTVTIDPGLYVKGTNGPSDRMQWSAGTKPYGGGEAWWWQKSGSFSGEISPENPLLVTMGWIQVSLGEVTAHADGTLTTDDPQAFTISGTTATWVTHPVQIDITGYDSGFWMNEINWQAGQGTLKNYIYNLPANKTGSYMISTPGGTNGTFNVGTDGAVTVVDPGSMGLANVDGVLKFTAAQQYHYKWEGPTSVAWWCGGGAEAGGANKGVEGDMGLCHGDYEIQWSSLPAGSWAGADKTFNVPVDGTGLSQVLTYNTNDYGAWTLTLTGPAMNGDANKDGKVDFADYLILEATFGGAPIAPDDADFDNNGVVDFADYLVLEASFGAGAAVPEPMTLSLLGLGALALIRRRS